MENEFLTLLLMEMSKGCTLYKICDLIAGAVKNPVAFSLRSETIIGHSKDFTRDLVEEFTLATQYMSEEEMNHMRNEFDRYLESGKPHIQAWPYIRHKQINCGCLYKGCVLGNLIVDVSNTKIDEIDLALIEQASACVGIWLAAHGYVTSRFSDNMQNFIKGLLLNDVKSYYQRKNIAYFPLNQTASFRIIWIFFREKMGEKTEYRIAKLCKRVRKWWHAAHEEGIAILIDAKYDSEMEALRTLLEEENGYACISDEYKDVYDTHFHYDICHSIMEIIQTWDEVERINYVNNYKLLFAFHYARTNMNSSIFNNEVLNQIIEYDKKYDSFYLETLKTYFICHYDYQKMAGLLNIKKNAVFYRMNKLCSLFHIDLTDTLQMTGLFYSLLAHEEKI